MEKLTGWRNQYREKLQPQPAGAGFSRPLRAGLLRLGMMMVTFHLVALAWIFFRATSIQNAVQVLRGIFAFRGNNDLAQESVRIAHVDLACAIIAMVFLFLLIELPQRRAGHHAALLRMPFLVKVVLVAIMAASVFLVREMDHVAFIYFQF